MSDITKCTNEDCKKKNSCLRYTYQSDSFMQSYTFFECDDENDWEFKLKINKIREKKK